MCNKEIVVTRLNVLVVLIRHYQAFIGILRVVAVVSINLPFDI
jgi:hypothetical protein